MSLVYSYPMIHSSIENSVIRDTDELIHWSACNLSNRKVSEVDFDQFWDQKIKELFLAPGGMPTGNIPKSDFWVLYFYNNFLSHRNEHIRNFKNDYFDKNKEKTWDDFYDFVNENRVLVSKSKANRSMQVIA